MKKNKAIIRVTFPDGCEHSDETRTDVDIATDSVKFARWLIDKGEELLERATNKGMCAAKSHRAASEASAQEDTK